MKGICGMIKLPFQGGCLVWYIHRVLPGGKISWAFSPKLNIQKTHIYITKHLKLLFNLEKSD